VQSIRGNPLPEHKANAKHLYNYGIIALCFGKPIQSAFYLPKEDFTLKTKIYWIAKTAMFIALLVALQAVTSMSVPPPAKQFVTGSCVNLILILSAVIGGVSSGTVVALISPVMAAALGVAGRWELVPFIALGNLVLVLIWGIICKLKTKNEFIPMGVSLVAGSLLKFAVLFVTVNQIAIPLVLKMEAGSKPALAISAQFGIAQLITAVIGGVVAAAAIPLVKNAIKGRDKAAV
jgi:hypothetical protein